MKTIKSFSFLLISILFFSSINVSYSQNEKVTKKSPEEIAKIYCDRMNSRLSLSNDQYKKIYSMKLECVNQRINNREMYKNLDKESRRNLKMKNKEEFGKKLENVLTKEQYKKHEQYISERQKFKSEKQKNKSERNNKSNRRINQSTM